MGTLFLNVSTVDGHWESSLLPYFDFKIEAAPLVPALGPQLSDFSIVVWFFFVCVFSFVSPASLGV